MAEPTAAATAWVAHPLVSDAASKLTPLANILALIGPKRFPAREDQTSYWVRADAPNMPAVISFMGEFDEKADSTKAGVKFSLGFAMTPFEVKKTKVVLAIKLLPQDSDYPTELIVQSHSVLKGVNELTKRFNSARDRGVKAAMQPRITPFFKVNIVEDYYVLLAHSNHIFKDPTTGPTSVIAVADDDLFLSPSASMKKVNAAAASVAADTLTLSDLPDINSVWSKFFTLHEEWRFAELNPPTILDEDGTLITPNNYMECLPDLHLKPVIVTAELRVWEFPPGRQDSNRNAGGSSPSKQNGNGSRAYQIFLKTLQFLPRLNNSGGIAPAIKNQPPTASTTGKRHAEDEGSSSAKKLKGNAAEGGAGGELDGDETMGN